MGADWLAQPWAVVRGNALSALQGVACARWFGSTSHRHLPIVDAGDRLMGIVTQSDVVAALARPDTTAA